eukprot:Amastigsp_a175656_7.p2 type:complete len:183 gc:universal Amastigsp_a175656_7:693-145(-)
MPHVETIHEEYNKARVRVQVEKNATDLADLEGARRAEGRSDPALLHIDKGPAKGVAALTVNVVLERCSRVGGDASNCVAVAAIAPQRPGVERVHAPLPVVPTRRERGCAKSGRTESRCVCHRHAVLVNDNVGALATGVKPQRRHFSCTSLAAHAGAVAQNHISKAPCAVAHPRDASVPRASR